MSRMPCVVAAAMLLLLFGGAHSLVAAEGAPLEGLSLPAEDSAVLVRLQKIESQGLIIKSLLIAGQAAGPLTASNRLDLLVSVAQLDLDGTAKAASATESIVRCEMHRVALDHLVDGEINNSMRGERKRFWEKLVKALSESCK